MIIIDEIIRDIVRFIKRFLFNSWFDDVLYIFFLYGEIEEDLIGSLFVEIKKKKNNFLFVFLCKNV